MVTGFWRKFPISGERLGERFLDECDAGNRVSLHGSGLAVMTGGPNLVPRRSDGRKPLPSLGKTPRSGLVWRPLREETSQFSALDPCGADFVVIE